MCNLGSMWNILLSLQSAIKALNTLQSNSSVLKEVSRSNQIHQNDRFEKAKEFCVRAKVPIDELDMLKAIHVSGTKGKVMTAIKMGIAK